MKRLRSGSTVWRLPALVGLVATLCLVTGPHLARADARGERPVQLQLDGSGFSLGYHFSETYYLGITNRLGYGPVDTSGFYDSPFGSGEEAELHGQKGVEQADITEGAAQGLELRISPWSIGLYFALGYVSLQESKEELSYDSRARVIGDGAYNDTSIDATITIPAQQAPVAGLGYNHVFQTGISLGIGMLWLTGGLDDPKVDLTTNNPDVTSSDLKKLRDRMVEDSRLTTFGHFAIGYNF